MPFKQKFNLLFKHLFILLVVQGSSSLGKEAKLVKSSFNGKQCEKVGDLMLQSTVHHEIPKLNSYAACVCFSYYKKIVKI